MSRIATPNALSEGMAKRAMPSRFALVLWAFSHLSADWTSWSSDCALPCGGLTLLRHALGYGNRVRGSRFLQCSFSRLLAFLNQRIAELIHQSVGLITSV